MNTRLLSLGSLAAVLAIASPSIAAEVAPVADTATITFNSEFVKSTDEAFTASTSAKSLGTFQAQGQINPTFTEDSSKTEVAQYDGTTETKTSGIYVGGLISFNSGDIDFGTYAGYNFNKNLGAEVELFFPGSGLYIIPTARYTIPLGSSDSTWAAFGGVGLGFWTEGGDLILNVKGGASYEFSPKFQVFAQLRYQNVFNGGGDNLNPELGLQYNF
jgi:hypothetical protein